MKKSLAQDVKHEHGAEGDARQDKIGRVAIIDIPAPPGTIPKGRPYERCAEHEHDRARDKGRKDNA